MGPRGETFPVRATQKTQTVGACETTCRLLLWPEAYLLVDPLLGTGAAVRENSDVKLAHSLQRDAASGLSWSFSQKVTYKQKKWKYTPVPA